MTRQIVKVIMPRKREHGSNYVLVFGQHESFIVPMPLRSRFYKELGESKRGYYYADYHNGHLQIHEQAPDQNW